MNKKKVALAILIVIIAVYILITLGVKTVLAQTEKNCDLFHQQLLENQNSQLEKERRNYQEFLLKYKDDNSISTMNLIKTAEFVKTTTSPLVLEELRWAKEKNDALPKKSDGWNLFELLDNFYERVGIIYAEAIIIESSAVSNFRFFSITELYTEEEGKKSSEPLSPAVFSEMVSKAKGINPTEEVDFHEWCKKPPLPKGHQIDEVSALIPFLSDEHRMCKESIPIIKEHIELLKKKFYNARPNSFEKGYFAIELLQLECTLSPEKCKLEN